MRKIPDVETGVGRLTPNERVVGFSEKKIPLSGVAAMKWVAVSFPAFLNQKEKVNFVPAAILGDATIADPPVPSKSKAESFAPFRSAAKAAPPVMAKAAAFEPESRALLSSLYHETGPTPDASVARCGPVIGAVPFLHV